MSPFLSTRRLPQGVTDSRTEVWPRGLASAAKSGPEGTHEIMDHQGATGDEFCLGPQGARGSLPILGRGRVKSGSAHRDRLTHHVGGGDPMAVFLRERSDILLPNTRTLR